MYDYCTISESDFTDQKLCNHLEIFFYLVYISQSVNQRSTLIFHVYDFCHSNRFYFVILRRK